jgi:hypothetical protein
LTIEPGIEAESAVIFRALLVNFPAHPNREIPTPSKENMPCLPDGAGIELVMQQALNSRMACPSYKLAAVREWLGGLKPPLDARFEFRIAWLLPLPTFFCYRVHHMSPRLYQAAPGIVISVLYLSPLMTIPGAAWAVFGAPLSMATFFRVAGTPFDVWLTSLSADAIA